MNPSDAQSHDRFSIFNLLSRIRSKKTKLPEESKDTRPPLRPSPLPLVLPEHQSNLSLQGWTTVTFPTPTPDFPQSHPLQKAYEELFAASKVFFALPDSEKSRWKTRLGSEEGWSKIPGEKEFITLRTLEYTPDVLKGAAKAYWDTAGGLLDRSLGRISASLGMSDEEGDGGLRKFVGECKGMREKDGEKTATMLRLFRYEGDEAKVVAEPHADLGLLSLVIGDTPGLEVWNRTDWFPIEQTYIRPGATLLSGRQLQRLSNFRYPAGGHRVVAYGRPEDSSSPSLNPNFTNYRYSIVFVLRMHEPVIVDTDALTTEITGEFETKFNGITAGQMYAEIRSAHFNINTGIQEREEQRRKLAEMKKKGAGMNQK
ncbi:hypothetical protein GQ43DRAFT_365230 [Delitschia confertaspora ATCC 74209]|uniref:Isopenicillin N synthase-like Fe(2+) 2OG dioxygenase domain-containing protein n=1 Tax=Delitschia confertaspora ATCC 74209 TaxID=1513339 RepID=A0A9P4JTL1_9PLEO|nr:hypothetical protein GQ43DRAFT_365230 [Delitschia confertaspora ATCC 74209]